MRDKITGSLDQAADQLRELCQWLYEHPETSLQEYASADKIVLFLKQAGFEVEEKLCGMDTAFRAVKKKGEGPTIAFLAEYDALPGGGHACGHHLITGMSVGAALALAEALDTLPGTVCLYGTPGEETGHGKPYLIEHGAFAGVDAAMMIHPHSQTCVEPEIIAIGGIDFTFSGRASHAGATPFKGINALDAVVLLYNNVNALRQQLKDGTRIHGIILEAGSAANTIPDKGRVRLEFRAKEQDYFDEVVPKVVRCAEAAALATGCTLSWEHFEPTCMGLTSDKMLAGLYKAHMESLGIYESDDKVMPGSSDVGNLSQVLPTIQPLLKTTECDDELHTPDFLASSIKPFAWERMLDGAKALALTGLSLLESPQIVKQLRGRG